MGESVEKKYSRTWRPAADVPQRRAESTRRLLIVLLIAALIAVFGVVIVLLFAWRPFKRADFLPLSISEYGEAFPVRSWVQQDGDALRGLDWRERNAFTSQERDSLLQELRKSARSDLRGPLVVYLNAYALTNPEGQVCVLPVDASLRRPESWLPLRTVLQLVSESKAPNKLLLLDIMQPFPDPQRGLLLNDAAEGAQPLLNEFVTNDPHLSVLCACAPGQESVLAEELGHSVFAYFLYEGLRGQADGENKDRKKDGRVSVQELGTYVAVQVNGWTLRHRRVRQTPRLYGAPDDYPLVSLNSQTAPPLQPPEQAAYPEWLKAGWKQRDPWLDGESHRLLPRTLRELEAALRRAEQLWRGGFLEEPVQQDLAARLARLQGQRSRLLPAARARAAALANNTLKAFQAAKADAETVKQAQQCCDEMLVQLPSYAAYLEVDAEVEPVWADAVTKVCALRQLLAAPPGEVPEVPIRKMTALIAALRNDRNNLNRLRRPLDPEPFERLMDRRQGGDDADLRLMTALLATPWPRAEQRSRLWSARQELLAERLQKRPVSNDKAGDEAKAILAQHRRAVQSARRSVKLLQLDGAEQLEKLEKALADAAEIPTDKGRLHVLAAELNRAWTRQNKMGDG